MGVHKYYYRNLEVKIIQLHFNNYCKYIMLVVYQGDTEHINTYIIKKITKKLILPLERNDLYSQLNIEWSDIE